MDYEQILEENKKLKARNYHLEQVFKQAKENKKTKSKEIIEKLRRENSQLKNELKKFNKTEIAKLKYELKTSQDALKLLEFRNKRIFGIYYEKIALPEDTHRLTFATVLLDYELMFTFQKYFEMHVFDYLVDRQSPEDKTERDTIELIKICKDWTSQVIINSTTKLSPTPEVFKQAFKQFTKPYIEEKYMQRG